jgi:hypothetical protein
MQIPYEILKTRLQSVLDGDTDHHGLTDLVYFSRTIIQSHLQHIRRSAIWLCRQQGISLEDLAFECVGEAFRRDGTSRFTVLESFAQSLDVGLDKSPEIEVFLAYRALLTRVADQHIARLFAEVDPAGGRIFRNIKEFVKRTDMFELDHDLRGLVLRPAKGDSIDHLTPFPLDELTRQLFGEVGQVRSTPGILRALHSVLTGQDLFRRSIPMIEVTAVFKRLYADDLESEQEETVSPFEGLSESDLEGIRGEVETVIRQKVLVTYVMKGKIGRDEARAIFNAFHDLLGEWIRSGKTVDGVMAHLERHLPLDRETYRSEYRPKMEYLLRIAREEFEARLMREI